MKKATKHRLVAAASAAVALAALAVGCGREGSGRAPVRGTVSLASGEKLSGSIAFLPSAGTKGPAATTRLVAGQYGFDHSNGPTAGPHRVIVTRLADKEKVLESLADTCGAESQCAKPDEAGGVKTMWTLSADVPAHAPYRCDFTLDP